MPRVTVYFATNRQPYTADGSDTIEDFGTELGPIGGLEVRYGSAKVDVDLKQKTKVMVRGSLKVADQKLLFPKGETARLGSTTIFEALRTDMKTAQRPTIAFIHGFS